MVKSVVGLAKLCTSQELRIMHQLDERQQEEKQLAFYGDSLLVDSSKTIPAASSLKTMTSLRTLMLYTSNFDVQVPVSHQVPPTSGE